MLIESSLNPSIIVNTDLVTDYSKGKRNERHAKPYTIQFNFAAGTSDDGPYVIWNFEREEDRDILWNKLMSALSVEWFD